MFRRRMLALAPLTLLAACNPTGGSAPLDDAGGDAPAEAGPPCSTNDDCDPSDCTCADGTSKQVVGTCTAHTCVTPGEACTALCGTGAVKAASAAPNVVGSVPCNDFCTKALGLGCEAGTACRPYFNCTVRDGGCAASTKAELQCEVEAGAWSCDPFGDWAVASGCAGGFTALCTGDGG